MIEASQQKPTAAHIVLDLETLSTKPNAAVIAIGAVGVSDTGQIVGEFHIAIDGHNQPGRHIDADTLAWWDDQTPEAKAASLQATDHVSATVAMCKFSAWVQETADPETVKMWGNGSSFDCTILSSLYADCHELRYAQPWAWWNDRDMRTLVDAFPTAKQVGDFEGIKHHALHDARHEAKQLAKALGFMQKPVNTDDMPTPPSVIDDGTLPTRVDELELSYVEACEERDHLRAVLAGSVTPSVSALSVPEGWRLVPVEPTPEMVHAVRFAGDPRAPAIGARIILGETVYPFVGEEVAERMCRAMLAAAPQAPAEGSAA